uniref:Uncharacterized protein n=1 Tax=uncultured marine virus TaxID=186617 RepID=A0A0F7L7K5_9VIRU|nr:hypothetical protein [uncultured marine virus]
MFFYMENMHVLPVDDLREHSERSDCECKPNIMVVENTNIISHNSYDLREYNELAQECYMDYLRE